jgi:hypothetical protein
MMKTNTKRLILGVMLSATELMSGCTPMKVKFERPFGSSSDVAYGDKLWKQLEEKGYNSTPSVLFEGSTPHGQVVEVLEGKIDGKTVLLKRNYRGEGITVEAVEKDRAAYLKAITVMAKREAGYDTEDQDWFYAQYKPDGSYVKKMGMIPIVGRVAKGIDNENCISCHMASPTGDFRFTSDRALIRDIL